MDEPKTRLHSLDALRGLAALSVVLYHWQHLQLLGAPKLTWPPLSVAADRVHEPLSPLFWLFYQRGELAVDMFFLISGFIFFWLYLDKLSSRVLSPAAFGALRFSRLYPLHLATLLAVAAMQAVFWRLTGQSFVYPANDGPHFLMSLLFIQRVDANGAFNEPAWSISIEILMYALFCGLARLGWLRGVLVPLGLCAIGLALRTVDPNLGRGLCGFFLGGLTYRLFLAIQRAPRPKPLLLSLLLAVVAGWATVVVGVYGGRAVSSTTREILICAVVYGLFPLTILVVALHENLIGARYAAIAWLGEISYSSYLLHFPLQLALGLTVAAGLLGAETARSGLAMFAYFALLIPLSLLVFRAFEIPVQKALRRQWVVIGQGGPTPVEALTP